MGFPCGLAWGALVLGLCGLLAASPTGLVSQQPLQVGGSQLAPGRGVWASLSLPTFQADP